MNWKLIRLVDRLVGIPLVWLFSILRPKQHDMPLDSVRPQRILLIKFWGIGNIFMMCPTLQGLKTGWPDTVLDLLTLTSNQDAAEISGNFTTIFSISTESPGHFLSSTIAIVKELRCNGYDIVIDFEQFARFSPLLTHLVNATRTIGFSTRGQHRHRLYTDTVEYDNTVHITRSFYQLIEKAGITTPFPSATTINHPLDDGSILKELSIPSDRPLAVLHIGTSDNFMERRWPPEYYGELCNLLIQQHGMSVALTGLADERHLTKATMAFIEERAHAIDLAGKLTFRRYFTLIAAAELVISADTAAVHIASALNKPVVGLYGPNTPHLYGPWGERGIAVSANFDCSPCITNFNAKINTCRHPAGRGACMRAITVQQVYNAMLANRMLPPVPGGDRQ